MSAYILQLDAKKFYPGTWDKMTPEEQAERQAQIHALQARRRGNTKVTPGVTPGKQKNSQPIHGKEIAGIQTHKKPYHTQNHVKTAANCRQGTSGGGIAAKCWSNVSWAWCCWSAAGCCCGCVPSVRHRKIGTRRRWCCWLLWGCGCCLRNRS